MQGEKVNIVLIEDDPGHIRLIEKNLRRSKIDNKIIIFNDGQSALDFIVSRSEDLSHRPILVLLDMNLPVLDGYQTLRIIKNSQRTAYIPIIAMTTTDNQHEIKRCYELGCNFYITKPVDYVDFADTIRKLGLFLSLIQVPE